MTIKPGAVVEVRRGDAWEKAVVKEIRRSIDRGPSVVFFDALPAPLTDVRRVKKSL